MKLIHRLLVVGVVFGVVSVYGQETFPKMHGLPVHNYGLPIPWDVFEEAFIAVRHGHPLDEALFQLLNNFSDNGVCFGMSALAGVVYDEQGYMGICKPAVAYTPRDTREGRDTLTEMWPVMKHAILTLWSRQFSPPLVRVVTEAVSSGYFQNPKGAAKQVDFYLSSGQIPVLLLSETMGPTGFGGMHAILPYRVEKMGTTIKIYVYDPTWPYAEYQSFYDTSGNFISINSFSNTWDYYWPDGTHWSGFIYVVPARYVLMPAINPFLIAEISTAVGHVIVNGGHVVAIRDKTSGLEFRTDGDSFFAKNDSALIFRWIPFNGRSPDNTELYIVRGGYKHELEVEVEPSDSNFEVKIAYLGKLVELTTSNPDSGAILLSLSSFGQSNQTVSVRPEHGELLCDMALHVAFGNSEVRSFEIQGVKVGQESSVKLAFDAHAENIRVESEITQAVRLEIYKFDGERKIELETVNLALTEGVPLTVKPRWKDGGLPIVVETCSDKE